MTAWHLLDDCLTTCQHYCQFKDYLVSNDEMKIMLLLFFSKLHGTVYFLYNDIASIDIDFDRCVFSSSSFFSFFFCSDIHRHDIDFLFFLRSLLSLLWKCAYIFWTSYFLKLFSFFSFLKLLIFFKLLLFKIRNKKNKK